MVLDASLTADASTRPISRETGEFAMYTTPNKYARPASLEENDDVWTFHGYQEFSLNKNRIDVLSIDNSLRRKSDLLAPYFTPRFLNGRSLLDFGANSAYFCFLALNNGAIGATAIDMDEEYLQMARKAKAKFNYNDLRIVRSNFQEWQDPADIVLALALIHWIYSCTASFGDLDGIIERFAKLTKHMLIIEWVEPDDQAINFFHHLDWNENVKRGPYTLQAFETALSKHFAGFECVGSIIPTRKLYIAYRSDYEISLSESLPIIREKETIISRRYLTTHEGVDYWSCVYDTEDSITKQATQDLAEREAYFLAKLNHVYFPKLLEVVSEAGYSVIKLEKIAGSPLPKTREQISASPEIFNAFVQHCMKMLEILWEHGIEHRDIRPDNILVREQKPVLIDFGWATTKDSPYFTPPSLNTPGGRPLDGVHCDVFSMGKIFEFINQHKFPAFDLVIGLMTSENGAVRVRNIDCLKKLFNAIVADGDSRLSADNKKIQKIVDCILAQNYRDKSLLSKIRLSMREQKSSAVSLSKVNELPAREDSSPLETRVRAFLSANVNSKNIELHARKAVLYFAPINSRRYRALRRLKNYAQNAYKKITGT